MSKEFTDRKHSAEHDGSTATRRTVVKGVAWAVPVVAIGVAAPSAWASTTSPCESVSFQLTPTSDASNPTILTATDSQGHVYQVMISSTLASNTVDGQAQPSSNIDYVSYNLNRAGDGWNGANIDDGSNDYQFTGFAPAGSGALVLNQRVATTVESTNTTTGSGAPVNTSADAQTLTFLFTKDGVPFDPANFTLSVFDITSGFQPLDQGSPDATGWRQNYWDAVGFSAAPSSVSYTGTIAGYGLGAGSGTVADPYHRQQDSQPTVAGETVSDVFDFASFPSGSQMVYSNYNGQQGWHFISISGISFQVGDCG